MTKREAMLSAIGIGPNVFGMQPLDNFNYSTSDVNQFSLTAYGEYSPVRLGVSTIRVKNAHVEPDRI